MHKGLAPAEHFIMVFISNSVGQVGTVVSILGLREEKERIRERGHTQQATGQIGVQLGLLATCQHGYFYWMSLAWW